MRPVTPSWKPCNTTEVVTEGSRRAVPTHPTPPPPGKARCRGPASRGRLRSGAVAIRQRSAAARPRPEPIRCGEPRNPAMARRGGAPHQHGSRSGSARGAAQSQDLSAEHPRRLAGHQPERGDDQHCQQKDDCLPGPAGQSATFQDPFQIDGEGHEQQSGERGRGTGLRNKQAFPFGGRIGGHQLRPLDSMKPLAGAGMRRTLPEGGRASEEPNRIDDVGQDQHHAGDQDHATHDVGDRQ
jgi:hypothetical protein